MFDDERSRFVGSRKHVVGVNDTGMNGIELLRIFVDAWLLVVQEHHEQALASDCVLLRGDNDASVA